MQSAMRADLKSAIKARDRAKVAVLRSALAAIANAEAIPVQTGDSAAGEHVAGAAVGVGSTEVQRRELSQAHQRSVVEAEIRERDEAASQYRQLDNVDQAERLNTEADVLRGYLGS